MTIRCRERDVVSLPDQNGSPIPHAGSFGGQGDPAPIHHKQGKGASLDAADHRVPSGGFEKHRPTLIATESRLRGSQYFYNSIFLALAKFHQNN